MNMSKNIVYRTYSPSIQYTRETELIDNVLKFSGLSVGIIFPHHEQYKKYIEKDKITILIFEELDKEPTVIYGFWNLCSFMLKNGMSGS